MKKGTENYLSKQKKYVVGKTILLFGVSLSLFIAGYVTTKSKVNVLTLVAVLGCLPACKSLVDMIMILRFPGCPAEVLKALGTYKEDLTVLYDMVFTTYSQNFELAHMCVRGNVLVGYHCHGKMDENAFGKHILDTLALEGISNVTVKVFSDLDKYQARLDQLKALEREEGKEEAVKNTLQSISL